LKLWGDLGEPSDGMADLRQILSRSEMIISVPSSIPVPLFKGAASGPALGPATAETGGAGVITHWQGVRATGMDRGGNTELLGDINVAALGTTSDIARAANQGFKDMVAGLAMVFVDWHKEESSHAGRSVRVDQPQ
jgi:hypothetical protein